MTTNKGRWWVTMIEKYGSEKEVREFLAQSGAAGKKTGTGGFAHMKLNDPERLKQLSSEAGKKRHVKTQDSQSAQEAS